MFISPFFAKLHGHRTSQVWGFQQARALVLGRMSAGDRTSALLGMTEDEAAAVLVVISQELINPTGSTYIPFYLLSFAFLAQVHSHWISELPGVKQARALVLGGMSAGDRTTALLGMSEDEAVAMLVL